MRILFVYPNIVESPKDISTGLAMLSAVCKQKGHQTSLIDSTFGITDKQIINKTKNFNPDIIAITIATNDFDYATHIAKIIKTSFPKIPIIAGGFHPTIAPEEVMSRKVFDIICIGEAEQTIIHLINNLKNKKSINKIKNLWIRDNKTKKVHKNPLNKLIQNLDSLPFPDRELFDYKQYLKWNHGTATFISTRGCPFKCSYCINHFLMNMYGIKGYVRFRSINHLFEEIKQVLNKYECVVKNIEFYDDTFTLDRERVIEFCKRYPKEIGLPFNLNARVNAIDLSLFKLLKKAGCARVSIGIEAGDEIIRNKVLKRNMSDEQIIKTFTAAKKAGLKTYSFNMVGMPFETKKTINSTIKLNRKCKPDYVGVSIFNVFRGTDAYELCKKKSWLRESYSSSYFRDSNVIHPNFSPSQLKKLRNNFGFWVFLTYNPLRAIVDLIDRNLSQINSYIFIRSKIIEKLRLLRK